MNTSINLLNQTIIDNHTTPSVLLEILFKNRQISTSHATQFLSPPSPNLLTPKDFGLKKTTVKNFIKIITQSIDQKLQILIYGDYDVDGITSTALLWQAINHLGGRVTPFVPHRQKDGYGLKYQSLIDFELKKGIKFDLVITVDNGIVAHKEIKKIKKHGPKVLVVDHHNASDVPNPADLLIHSTQVAASGLAWFLSSQLHPGADLGLATLGTVADCLPLVGINRSLVVHGLKFLRINPSPGLKKLISISGARQDSISVYDIGFLLAPRINAAGRLSDPTDALRLLCSSNSLQADKYAQILNELNLVRQQMQTDNVNQAISSMPQTNDKLLLVASADYHPGIIGLISGKLTEKYGLPSIAISIEGDLCKGSCRSVAGFDIITALRSVSDLLLDVGGHTQAAGFSLDIKNLETFKKRIVKIANKSIDDSNLSLSVDVDARLKLNAVTQKNIKLISSLEPFGIGNPRPLFLLENLSIIQKKTVGSDSSHLKLKLDDPLTPKVEYLSTDAIAFNQGQMDGSLHLGSRVDIVASLDINTYQGHRFPQLLVKEIRPL